MTRFHNSFEGGTSGSNLIVSTSGGTSGDAFTGALSNNAAVGGSGNANVTYQSAAALAGSLGLRITLTASTSYVYWQDASGGTRGVMRFPLKISANPSATTTVGILRNSSGSMAYLQVLTSGVLRAYNAGNTALSGSDYTLTVATQYWVELAATAGTTTSDGRIEVRVLASDGTTQLAAWDSGAATNTGTTNAYLARFGVATTTSGWSSMDLDEIQFDSDLASGWIGPYVAANTAPTAATGGDQTVDAGVAVELDGTGSSDSDGTISGWAWTQTSGDTVTLTGASTSEASFTAPFSMIEKTYVFELEVTDDDAATDTAECTITVPAHPDWYLNAGGVWRPLVKSWL